MSCVQHDFYLFGENCFYSMVLCNIVESVCAFCSHWFTVHLQVGKIISAFCLGGNRYTAVFCHILRGSDGSPWRGIYGSCNFKGAQFRESRWYDCISLCCKGAGEGCIRVFYRNTIFAYCDRKQLIASRGSHCIRYDFPLLCFLLVYGDSAASLLKYRSDGINLSFFLAAGSVGALICVRSVCSPLGASSCANTVGAKEKTVSSMHTAIAKLKILVLFLIMFTSFINNNQILIWKRFYYTIGIKKYSIVSALRTIFYMGIFL